MLDFPVPKVFRILFFAVLLLLPSTYITSKYNPETHFTSLICFGSELSTSSLKEVREIPKTCIGTIGYDGQYYAQIAVDPSLRNPQLRSALDSPWYRAKRILVPALCYVIGLGKPWLIVQAYALINMIFYALLLGGLIYFIKPHSVRELLGIGTIMWTTGCLVSIERSLLDLPAATFVFLAASMGNRWSFPIFSAAVLTKETALFSILAVAWSRSWRGKEICTTAILTAGAIIAPIICWSGYVSSIFGGSIVEKSHSLGGPLIGLFEKVYGSGASLLTIFTKQSISAFLAVFSLSELLTVLSLIVEALYVIIKPRLDSPYWRMGIGFALLYFFLAEPAFIEQIGYTRIVLPLTVAFNLLLIQHERRHFIAWFCAGNVGLAFWICRWIGQLLKHIM